MNGKKPKKGAAFNGLATISLANEEDHETYNFGLRHKKCIKIDSERISQLKGNFVNDNLQVQT